MTESAVPPGKVYLVGAGPGDPGLLTLRGQQCLARADLVLYDYLVNAEILSHAHRGAELVCLGRHGHGKLLSQDEICRQMVAAARQGRVVVRLKGGDPAIFARLAEETSALDDAGLTYEIVPGVTAALAAASYTGISVTHREWSSAVALITGHEAENKPGGELDYGSLASFPGTLVIYMGVTTAESWSQTLISAGKPADTPVAVVRRCSWPDQYCWRCRLDQLADLLDQQREDRIRPPVVVIVGQVAAEDISSSWFTSRPLFGQRVLVTRPIDQAGPLKSSLEELGADILLQPAIEISDPPDWQPVDTAIARLSSFDWLVFSSSNGVRMLLERLFAQGQDLRALAGAKLAAIGPGTENALAEWKLRADLVPPEYRAEALATALADQAAGKKFLLLRASRGREVLAEQLTAAGAEVEQVVVYSSTDIERPNDEVRQSLAAGQLDWVTVTSSAIARSLAKLFGEDLHRARLASISPITSGDLRKLGFEPAAEAREYTMDGVVAAIVEAERQASH